MRIELIVRSAEPPASMSARALLSRTVRMRTRSVRGAAKGQCGLRRSRMSSASNDSTRYGPAPTTLPPSKRRSAPAARRDTMPNSRSESSVASGSVRWMRTRRSSSASKPANRSRMLRRSALSIAGSRALSKVKTTSAEVSAVPSEKRRCGRSVTSAVRGSRQTIDSASSRRGSAVPFSTLVKPGATRRDSFTSSTLLV